MSKYNTCRGGSLTIFLAAKTLPTKKTSQHKITPTLTFPQTRNTRRAIHHLSRPNTKALLWHAACAQSRYYCCAKKLSKTGAKAPAEDTSLFLSLSRPPFPLNKMKLAHTLTFKNFEWRSDARVGRAREERCILRSLVTLSRQQEFGLKHTHTNTHMCYTHTPVG